MNKILKIAGLLYLLMLMSGCSNDMYTIRFESNGGSDVSSISAKFGTLIEAPQKPIKEGYAFAGWYTSNSFDNPFSFNIMPKQNVVVYAKWESNDISFLAKQQKNLQSIEVSWEFEIEEVIEKAQVIVTHNDILVSSLTVTDQKTLTENMIEVYAYYGKHNVSVTLTSVNNETFKFNQDVVVTNEEYNIAPLSGSMPVMLFSLSIDEITNNGKVPTFVWLTRSGSYNWNKLPENVFMMPNVNQKEILKHDNYNMMMQKTLEYIKELTFIDSSSKINLYLNDYNVYMYLNFFVANNIDEDRYSVTLLSDGTASYNDFNKAFSKEVNPFIKLEEMKTNWKLLKEKVYQTMKYENTSEYIIDTTLLRQYTYCIVDSEDNVEWWLTRLNGTLNATQDFIDSVVNNSKVLEKSISGILLEIQKDEAKTKQLKELYNFSEDMFSEAKFQNKPVMLILGSKVNIEVDFINYANATMEYYGDGYVYYYKGHPGTPTGLYPSKEEQLKNLGIIDVESSIAAELILFFYPDIYMCGYPSSTYLSVSSSEMAGALFNTTKEKAVSFPYYSLLNVFISAIDEEKYSEIIINEHQNYLIEFKENSNIGIYDATVNTIRYYKQLENGYQEIIS